MLLTDFMKHVSNRIWEETLTHTVTHIGWQSAALPPTASSCPMGTTKYAERLKEYRRGNCLLSGIFASFFCSHHLRHEAAHFLRGLLLHLPCGVGVGAEREARVVVPEHTADDILKQIRN